MTLSMALSDVDRVDESEIPTDDRAALPEVQLSDAEMETVRIHVYGTSDGVKRVLCVLELLEYARVKDWSPPQPTGNPDEIVRVLVRRFRK